MKLRFLRVRSSAAAFSNVSPENHHA